MSVADLYRPRWRGQPGRLEVWYATLTDPASNTGMWLHHEIVSPTDSSRPYAHGWAAVFPPDGPPVLERFGPAAVSAGTVGNDTYFRFAEVVAEVSASVYSLTGSVGSIRYRLELETKGEPLYTFPRWAWQRETLPAAQVVPAPAAAFTGIIDVRGRQLPLMDAPGEVARVYGNGNARRWAWLHADLGGGDVLEIVVTAARESRWARLPPLAFVQLRRGGRDWPVDPLLAAPLFRSRIDLLDWSVRGSVGRRRLRVQVRQEQDASVRLVYRDPDGSTATCCNSERANAEILLERWSRSWQVEGQWKLDHTAHAEVGTRP
ncbi:MAG: hypothetical protein GEV03_21750 [Streptosporangiales bacterium]|nr:hypothetical protein [Streptosporangiales bacterium]